jgi:glycosyltransferase involved in cell wall biosynthesis
VEKQDNKLVIFTDWYAPGYRAGGPIRSLTNLVALIKGDFTVRVVTSNTDFGVKEPYPNIQPNKWMEKDGAGIIYLNNRYTMFSFLMRMVNVKQDEVVYLNSLFSMRFTLLPLLFFRWVFKVKRIVVAPRGMLGKGALAIKGSKKQWFLKAVKLIGLFKGVLWHATSREEAEEIKLHFGQQAMVMIVPNVPTITTAPLHKRKKVKEQLKLVFCSRITKKKNLLFALETLEEMALHLNGITIQFDLYGPIEDDAYWRKCNDIIKRLGKHIEVNYRGVLQPNELSEVFNEGHLFFLPTAHENYGHVIVEAMATGMPVLLSTNTPWRNLENEGVGWDIDLNDKVKFAEIIKHCASMDQVAYDQLSANTYTWIRNKVDLNELKTQLYKLFQHQ